MSGEELLMAQMMVDEPSLVLLMQDDFSGSGTVDLRVPDVLQVGSNVWHDTLWTPEASVVSGGYANGITKVLRYDSGEADVKVTAIVKSVGVSSSDDNVVFGRISDVTDDGFPTDCIILGVEHDTNLIRFTERVGASNIQQVTTSYNPPEGVDFELTLVVKGTTAYAYAEGGLFLTLTGLLDTTATNHGMTLRGTGTVTYLATVQSFKVEAI